MYCQYIRYQFIKQNIFSISQTFINYIKHLSHIANTPGYIGEALVNKRGYSSLDLFWVIMLEATIAGNKSYSNDMIQ